MVNKDRLRAYILTTMGYVLGIALLANSALVIYLYYLQRMSDEDRNRAEIAERYIQTLRTNAVYADFIAREAMIFNDDRTINRYEETVGDVSKAFDSLTYNLRKYGFNETLLGRLEISVSDALKNHRQFLDSFLYPDSAAARPSLATFTSAFDAVQRDFSLIEAYINQIKSDKSGSGWLWLAVLLQLVLLLCVPVAFGLPRSVLRLRRRLVNLNRAIDESNRKYVFDSLEEVNLEDEEAVRTRLLNNLRQAATFIQEVARKNYDVRWEGMNDTNRDVNRDNIAGELIQMRQLMKKVK